MVAVILWINTIEHDIFGKDQESIQSSTISDPGHHMGK